MEVVYLKEFDNKRMYINRKYKGKYEDKKYEVVYFDEGKINSKTHRTGICDKVRLYVDKPNLLVLYDNKWLSTHPNGLLGFTPPLGASIGTGGSYAVDENHRYYTAWHVGMIYFTSKYTILNVPMNLYHKDALITVKFEPSIYTPPAWLREKNLYQLEYDTMEIIPSTYQSLLTTPPGKLLGVISVSFSTRDGLVTGCSKIPGVRVRRNARIETIGQNSGERFGNVISTRAESLVELEKDLFVLQKNLFTVTNLSIPGDSGGGCYMVGIQ